MTLIEGDKTIKDIKKTFEEKYVKQSKNKRKPLTLLFNDTYEISDNFSAHQCLGDLDKLTVMPNNICKQYRRDLIKHSETH